MTKIYSKRGRQIRDEAAAKRRLEEKYQLQQLPLSQEEQELIGRVFDRIRRDLDSIVKNSRGEQNA